jgi:hypothetical protein
MKTRRYRRFALWALLVLLAAWLLPSLLSAERFRRRLEVRLEQALGRSVHFGSISPKLVPHPGFSLDNVTVREDPAFGSEPFARVDHVDCDLVLGSLARGRIELGRLRLQGATINLVRNPADHWNVERVVSAAGPAPAGSKPPPLSVELQDARLNFKEGSTKKPFTVTALDGRVTIDRGRGVVSFDVSGTPIRTDLGLPSPGRLGLTGTWKPPAGGTIDVALRTRGALLYDWIPLVSGRNPEIYGIMDADAHVAGPLASLVVDAQLRLSQVRRWESLPPTGDLPVNVAFKAALDRASAELRLDHVTADFGNSHVQLAGSIVMPGVVSGVQDGSHAVLDLMASAEGARLEDVSALAGRLISKPASWQSFGSASAAGFADARMIIQGPWSEPGYFGSINTRSAHLIVRGVSLPLSDTVIRAQDRRIELAATRISATPNLAITAEGGLQFTESSPPANAPKGGAGAARAERRVVSVHPGPPVPGFQFTLSTRAATCQEMLDFARALGFPAARDFDARGLFSATVTAAGSGWPSSQPVLSASAEVHSAEIGLPGLSRPLEIREAHVQVKDDRVSINPAAFSIGEGTFTGHIEHTGPRAKPWTFELRAAGPQGGLDLGQAASWFEALGHRPAFDWLAQIPGLGTLGARRAAGTTLFNRLNAHGEFSTPALSYQGVSLHDFQAEVDMGQRVVRVSSATFRMSTGHGRAEATADLSGPLPRVAADFAIAGLRVENWASHLPPQLAGVRGSVGIEGRLSAQGTSRSELQSTLEGRGILSLANLDLGRFDPSRDAAHAASWGDLAPSRGPVTLRAATLELEVRSENLIVKPTRFEFAGAAFELSGTCAFDRNAQFESTADLRHISRRWLVDNYAEGGRVTRFLLTGPLDALNATQEDREPAAAPGQP